MSSITTTRPMISLEDQRHFRNLAVDYATGLAKHQPYPEVSEVLTNADTFFKYIAYGETTKV